MIMNRDDLAKDVVAFGEQCAWLRRCFDTYLVIFEGRPETFRLLERSACGFFQDLNIVLIEYCWLQIGKLTDPAKHGGRTNLTVDYLNQELSRLGLLTPAIKEAAAFLLRYREFIA